MEVAPREMLGRREIPLLAIFTAFSLLIEVICFLHEKLNLI